MIFSNQYGYLLKITDKSQCLSFEFQFKAHTGHNQYTYGAIYTIEASLIEVIRNTELNKIRNEWMDSDDYLRMHLGEEQFLEAIDYMWLDILIEKWLGKKFPYATNICGDCVNKDTLDIIDIYQILRKYLINVKSWLKTDSILTEAYLNYLEGIWDFLLFNKRAEYLFDSLVEDSKGFKARGYMDVRGSNGKLYRINKSYHGNVICLDDKTRFCCVVPDVPMYDHWLAQKMIIENCIEEFLAKANVENVPVVVDDGPRLDPLDMYEQGIGEFDV